MLLLRFLAVVARSQGGDPPRVLCVERPVLPQNLCKKAPDRMTHRIFLTAWIVVVAGVAVVSVGCGDGSVQGKSPRRLTLTGSSTMAPLLAEIAKRYEQQHPGVRIDVQSGGSSRGIRDVLSGVASFGMSSRDLKGEERSSGLVAVPVARDGVGFVVHADNPVSAISRKDAATLYTGGFSRWSQLGGADTDIIVVGRADGRSEVDLVTDYLQVEPTDLVSGLIVGENQQAVKTVEGNPLAVVYLSIGTTEYAIAQGRPLKLLALDGVEASGDTVRDGRYPLSRPLLMVYKEGPLAPEAQRFLDFARSADVADLVREQSFVPLTH